MPDDTDDTRDALLLMEAPVALVAVREGRIIRANRRVAALAGRPIEDVEAMALVDLLVGPPELVEDGRPHVTALRRPEGDELPVEVRISPTDDASGTWILAIQDARALLAGRAAREEAEQRYRVLVEQIPAIVYIDKEGKGTVYVSPQIEQILGVSPEDYCADPNLWGALLHPDDRERVEREYEAFLVGEGGDLGDYRMLTPDGRVVWIRDRAVTVRDERGRVLWEHGVMFDVTELKEAEAQVAHLAYHDRLTGLPNRALFEETLALAVGRATRHDLAVAVVFLDLDNFKLVNDSLGHHAGDVLLTQLADRLRRCTRESDLVARQGGDEFLLLVSDLERGETEGGDGRDAAILAAEAVATRVHDALREPFDLGGIEFFARGSIGISLFPGDAHDAVDLMKNADAAMYRSKRVAPGGSAFFHVESDDPARELTFATRLRKAVEHEQWVLHYQPVVDLADGGVTGVEALIRWQDASGGIVPPGEFIPVAEELGLIEAIGDWVLDEVAQQQRAWKAAGLDLELSFNLSPRQLWAPHLAERVLGKVRAANGDVTGFVVEITESTAMADPERTLQVLEELHAWGFRLAIDDFGTGYSSLAHLKHMPVDVLKIDRAFVRDVDTEPRLARMVRAMIQLAQSLDMVPLAEGVETFGEYEFLRANGCRFAQGFWFSRPVPAERIPALAMRPGGLVPAEAAR
jgi:diguanylate cyclase (GGDEF)-like protein/PAS domain S-box-containing protein